MGRNGAAVGRPRRLGVRLLRYGGHGHAAMGPRSDDRGDPSLLGPPLEQVDAAMGPRSDDRGDT